ncbi:MULTISPECIES: efflux RND transporter periplasmic adaptor subunit [unclassified Shewanella]|uniref:efflux RND transporter periplasmic adaptor subunit n=1 Tax=unclassified Shewanella TaxID=196818 RepID=UPI000C84FE66|nr:MULTISPECIES: efflux RND transporter periplasmic adaptor subunit [unclassified Shewanella]MDO6619946.1 efflux RND transporter periplasmic adaptor subunit [Shewanella sp. 6_MG-2023]MDO6639572.1 efflux RND transporter periplasmic adaptor subunit [Shewanella sp. 5_MG-2023]MDO6775095.1 efflux RND transporter periplasmic adaptor subunit [Shewanella sp. 3_MG-2023]PMG30493.1 efflux transporter periplasmic adaptor subunit [Shewanella sp. 10N.286.52.C2]PMG49570.1 efflux transporter periplasmic adapt
MRKALKIASVITAALWITACGQAEQGQGQQKAPPAPVGVMSVTEQSQAIYVELPGRSRAFLEAEVRPQVSGIITNRGFVEGKDVEAGQSLYQIDSATYKAALVSAEADLASANAALASAKATADRYAALVKTNAISAQDFDEADAAYKEAIAKVTVAEAAINTAKINLEYTEVRAPISGRIGTSSVTPGALVTANQSNTLAKIQQLDPINIDIAQSSAQLLRLKSKLRQGKLQQSENAEVTLILEDGSTYENVGTLQFSEVSVNEATGSVIIRAEFPNPDGVLLPGMYVRAILNAGQDPSAILVPQKAITRNTKGEAVAMIVNADNQAEARVVKTAEVINHQWRITEGLKAGDKLIVEGLQKVRPGAEVAPQVLTENTPTK